MYALRVGKPPDRAVTRGDTGRGAGFTDPGRVVYGNVMQDPMQNMSGDEQVDDTAFEEWVERNVSENIVVVDLEKVREDDQDTVLGAVNVIGERTEKHVVVLPAVQE